MKKANTKHIKGWFAERLAAIFLWLKGYKIISCNHKEWAEIDILAIKNNILVAVEVKYRKQRTDALTAISTHQKERLQRQVTHLVGAYSATGARVEAVLVFLEWPFIIHVEHVEK